MKIIKIVGIVLVVIALVILPIIPIKYNPPVNCLKSPCPIYRFANILGIVMHQIQPDSDVWKY